MSGQHLCAGLTPDLWKWQSFIWVSPWRSSANSYVCNNTPTTVITQACSGEERQAVRYEGSVGRSREVERVCRQNGSGGGWMAAFIHPHSSSPPFSCCYLPLWSWMGGEQWDTVWFSTVRVGGVWGALHAILVKGRDRRARHTRLLNGLFPC